MTKAGHFLHGDHQFRFVDRILVICLLHFSLQTTQSSYTRLCDTKKSGSLISFLCVMHSVTQQAGRLRSIRH
ncbi:hypothetical protein KC19_VG085000 [Ceratodon purpureus]|uniref:Secreted protein n=1 Tax=Ceratodon purpureus TaxID=3225 RepID=A0A8T0HNU2_CERPU|nr:hypothetical protein KC19_VG085000 [Ceratodon purpureus]